MDKTKLSQSGAKSNAPAENRDAQVIDWKPFGKNTLKGFFSIALPSGLVIHDLTYHQKNDSRWIGLPAKQFTKSDGAQSWTPVIEIPDRDARERFQRAAIAAIDRHLGGEA